MSCTMKYRREAPHRATGAPAGRKPDRPLMRTLTRVSWTTPDVVRRIAHLWAVARPSLYDPAVKKAPRSAWLLAFAVASSACGVEFLPSGSDEAVANMCETDADCG